MPTHLRQLSRVAHSPFRGILRSGASLHVKRLTIPADAADVNTRQNLRGALARRLSREEGYTLIELLTVMVVMGIVMTAIISGFVSATTAEAAQTRREQANQNARLAMQRMRADMHCATGVTSVDENGDGGFTLTLNEIPSGDGSCPGVIPTGGGDAGVQWCTRQRTGSTTRWLLFRYLGTTLADCPDSPTATFEVDYIATPPAGWPQNTISTDYATGLTVPPTWNGNLWPTAATCTSGTLPTVAIDLNVALDPVAHANEHYELRDAIALRNALRC